MNLLTTPLRFKHFLAWPSSWRWLLLGNMLMAVAVLGALPGSPDHGSVPGLRGFVTNLAHQPLYAGVGLSLLLALGREAAWREWPLLLLFVLVVGLVDEWHQSHVPYRDSSWWDLGSDLLGVTSGLALAIASDGDPPLRQRLGLVALVVLGGLAWNCLPAFAPPWLLFPAS